MPGFKITPILFASFSYVQRFNSSNPGNKYANLRPVVEKANVSKIAFLRHGQTAPSEGVDFDRLLTETGRLQARQAGLSFGKDLKPFFSPVLVSPAPRTMETAKLFLSNAEENVDLKAVEPLYDGTMQPKGSVLFKKFGYAPLRDYIENRNTSERDDAQDVLGSYAETVAGAIIDLFEDETCSPRDPSTLWMIGHAIYLPAAALGVATLLGCSEEKKSLLLSSITQEAEGYVIDVKCRDVRYLARP